MTKSSLLLISTCLLFSCSKDADFKDSRAVSATEVSQIVDGSSVWVTLTSNGEYISSYGNGITFSTVLPHPIGDADGVNDGTPISSIEYVNWTLNTAPVTAVISGPYFTLFEPTFPTTAIQITNNYLKARDTYQKQILQINTTILNPNTGDPYTQQEKKDMIAAIPVPSISGNVSPSSDYVKIVSGLLIQDHTSPTRMSVVDQKFVAPVPVKLVGACRIQTLYNLTMYAPQSTTGGAVTKVIAKNTAGTIINVQSFNIQYTSNADGTYHTQGTVTINSIVYNINSTLDL